MNRRSFLTALAGAFALDPERLLWVPGQRLISIPEPPPVITDLWDPLYIWDPWDQAWRVPTQDRAYYERYNAELRRMIGPQALQIKVYA